MVEQYSEATVGKLTSCAEEPRPFSREAKVGNSAKRNQQTLNERHHPDPYPMNPFPPVEIARLNSIL
jgi:hypothetical protein